jgi:hypothetical protein
MFTNASSSFVSKEIDAVRMIQGVALATLASVCILLLSEPPAWPIQPEWLHGQGNRLLRLGPMLLIACVALRLTPLLRPDTAGSSRWSHRSRLLAMVLALAFGVLIPLLLISGERVLQRQNQQDLNTIRATRATAVAIAEASDLNSFRAALARVVQPQTIPEAFDQPLSQLKASTLAGLERSLRTTRRQLEQASAARSQRFLTAALGQAASAALLCLGFAAVARSWDLCQ